MRRVRSCAAVSLDGYIAGPNGESDWIVMDPDIDFGALMASFDTVLLGRKTYEATRHHGGGGGLFRSLLDLRLVDTVELAVIPVLLGEGMPLLPRFAGRTELTLDKHRVYPRTGTVSLEYALA